MVNRTDGGVVDDGSYCVDRILGLYEHEGEVRDLILGLKYAGRRRNARYLASMIVGGAGDLLEGFDIVTWAPTTDERRRSRGFDQAELIARHLAAFLGLRCAALLRRDNDGSQTGSGRSERMCRPRFVARPVRPTLRVLVVDDVVTTGATLSAAIRALRATGVTQTLGLAVTRVS